MKKTGLYFGSFNPVHLGHLIVADYFANQTDLDEVWFVVSPHNPFKHAADLANENDRLNMLRLAIGNNPKLMASDIEFFLPKPSYTCDTLAHLSQTFPEKQFTILLGDDNQARFSQWKNFRWILENYPIRFFPRHASESADPAIDWNNLDVAVMNAPRIEISSTRIRENIRKEKSNRYQLSDSVVEYIQQHGLYRNED